MNCCCFGPFGALLVMGLVGFWVRLFLLAGWTAAEVTLDPG